MTKPAFIPHGRPGKRRTPPDPKKPETWYTRSEAAKILGIHKNTLAGWDTKLLHPVLVDGFYRYHPAEVSGIKERRRKKAGEPVTGPTKGEIEAAAFKMLDDGASRREMVIALHITHEEAQEYWEAHRLDFEQSAAQQSRKREEDRLAKLEAEERIASEQRRNDRMARLKAMVDTDAGPYKVTGGNTR
jgi:hypothetical protein